MVHGHNLFISTPDGNEALARHQVNDFAACAASPVIAELFITSLHEHNMKAKCASMGLKRSKWCNGVAFFKPKTLSSLSAKNAHGLHAPHHWLGSLVIRELSKSVPLNPAVVSWWLDWVEAMGRQGAALLLRRRTRYFVCGDARMANECHEACEQVLRKHGEMSRVAAVHVLNKMRMEGRWSMAVSDDTEPMMYGILLTFSYPTRLTSC